MGPGKTSRITVNSLRENRMNRVVISVRISHPKWDHAAITKLLNCEPDISRTVGENRKTPTGQNLEGTNPNTYWCKDLSYEGDSLSAAIEKGLRLFDPIPGAGAAIRQDGGSVEFFIGWFFDANGGDILLSPIMRRLADHGIDLSFDVYGPEVRMVTGRP